MASVKISELTAIVTPADADELVIDSPVVVFSALHKITVKLNKTYYKQLFGAYD